MAERESVHGAGISAEMLPELADEVGRSFLKQNEMSNCS